MLDSPVDFKEQMIEARRTQILVGAAQVFSQKGFHKATTKEIAKTAGVSEGTIYNYFKNKRELLLAMVEMFATRTLKHRVFDNPPEDPREFFKALLQDRYELVTEYGHILAPLLAEVFADTDLREALYYHIIKPIITPVEQYIQHHIDSGQFRPVNPVIITRALVGAMALNTTIKLTGIDHRFNDLPADEMIEQVIELIMQGVSVR